MAHEPASWLHLLLELDARPLRRQLPGHSRPPPATGDLRRIKQQLGETLQKYIQRFNRVRLKILKVTDEAIISAFSDSICDIKMKEELAIHEELCTTLELFNLATKCTRAEEGRPPPPRAPCC